MGQNSPIELQMTSAGLAAKDNVDSIIFTRFVAGSGGNNLATEVADIKQTIPIVDFQKYTAGNTYNIDGVSTVATESSLKLTGYGNAIDAEGNYILNEIGLMAKLSNDGEEFCFAYDWSDTDTRRIRITRSQGIQVVYNIIFSRQPNLTVNTSATGVTYTDFYNHTQKAVSSSPVHGMTWDNNQLTINGQVFDGASNERLKKIVGIDSYYSILPTPVMSLFEKVALVTTSNNIYRCQKTQEISTGQFIINDNGWKRANGSEAEAILVIDDGLTPSANEICLTDAQNHFMEWNQLGNFESRLKYLEANSQFLQYDPLDNRVYNSEWVDRITGSGTPASPYLIYTPKDFSMIGKTEQYSLDKCYKLMNNLDFSEVIGMTVTIEDEGYTINSLNQEAPLYNNGEGLWPIGYDGYYPTYTNTLRGKTWQEVLDSGNAWNNNVNSGGYASTANKDGYEYYAFTGEFDGNNKVLKGIVCAPVNTFSVGLFMFTSKSASIHHFTIKDSVFILSDVQIGKGSTNAYWDSALSAVVGMLSSANMTDNQSVTMFNIYNYATLINNTARSGTNGFTWTAPILGYNNNQTKCYFSVSDCTNHGKLIYVSETPKHYMAGIALSEQTTDDNQEIMNCINTSSITGYKAYGIGRGYWSKININCGIIHSYDSDENSDYNAAGFQNYYNGSGPIFINNQTYIPSSNISGAGSKIHPKLPTELKSEDFITEANSYVSLPAIVYNDLGVNDGWPLLVDEYNTLIGIDGNLSLAVVDPSNKKIYKSGLPMKKFQTIPTYKEMIANTNQTVETKITDFNSEILAGLKIATVTIASTNWSAEEESGTPTGKYVATKSISGMTATSPVQLLSQVSEDEVKIKSTSSNSVVFICDTEPASDIKVSVMFTV